MICNSNLKKNVLNKTLSLTKHDFANIFDSLSYPNAKPNILKDF